MSRILVVHSPYVQSFPSGENVFVNKQIQALEAQGIEVIKLSARQSTVRGFLSLLKYIWDINRELRFLLNREYDAVVLHNLVPLLVPFRALLRQSNILRFVHNYRSLCVAGSFFRDGKDCTLCISRTLSAIKNKCYQDSFIKSILAKLHQQTELRLIQSSQVKVIFLSKESQNLIKNQLEIRKAFLLPNFSSFHRPFLPQADRNGRWLFVGRISEEKGIRALLEVWPENHFLDVIGDGPLLPELQELFRNKGNIQFKGMIESRNLANIMRCYAGAIFPSLWSEISSLVLREFVSTGLPIIMLGHPNRESLFRDFRTSVELDFLSTNGIETAINQIEENYEQFLANLKKLNTEKLSLDLWISQFNAILSE
jgi:glycosyltransferase involved in cell wall biosynthesis